MAMAAKQRAPRSSEGRKRKRPSATRQLRHVGAQLLETMRRPALVTNEHGKIVAWNPAAEKAFGHDLASALGQSPAELLAVGDAEAIWDAIDSRLRRGMIWTGVLEMADLTGKRIRFETTVWPLTDDKQNLLGGLWIHQHGAVVKSQIETSYRLLLDHVPIAVFVYQDARVHYANAVAQEMTGYTEDELRSMAPWEVVHPAFREIIREWGMARERGEPVPDHYEVRYMTRDGQDRWADYSAVAIEFDGRPAVMGMVVDITERKRAAQSIPPNLTEDHA
jgi:PAS domain S-box-containing protein